MFDREIVQRSCQETSWREIDKKSYRHLVPRQILYRDLWQRITTGILAKGTYAGSLTQDCLQRDPVTESLILQRLSQKGLAKSTLAFLCHVLCSPVWHLLPGVFHFLPRKFWIHVAVFASLVTPHSYRTGCHTSTNMSGYSCFFPTCQVQFSRFKHMCASLLRRLPKVMASPAAVRAECQNGCQNLVQIECHNI